MPKKKPRSVSFTFHMDGQDGRGVCVKLSDAPGTNVLSLTCRLADMNAVVAGCPLAEYLFSIQRRVKARDKRKSGEDQGESSMSLSVRTPITDKKDAR